MPPSRVAVLAERKTGQSPFRVWICQALTIAADREDRQDRQERQDRRWRRQRSPVPASWARQRPMWRTVHYEHAAPINILHIDTKKLGRIKRVGRRITGKPRDTVRAAGWEPLFAAMGHARIGFTARHVPQFSRLRSSRNNTLTLHTSSRATRRTQPTCTSGVRACQSGCGVPRRAHRPSAARAPSRRRERARSRCSYRRLRAPGWPSR